VCEEFPDFKENAETCTYSPREKIRLRLDGHLTTERKNSCQKSLSKATPKVRKEGEDAENKRRACMAVAARQFRKGKRLRKAGTAGRSEGKEMLTDRKLWPGRRKRVVKNQ